MNTRSVDVLLELKEILQANPLVTLAIIDKVEPLASETNQVAVYIQHTNALPKIQRASTEIDGYDYHGFYTLVANVDCTEDALKVYDVADSIQRSILNDSTIWTSLVDRDIIAIEYDNFEFSPKRSVVIAIEVVFRLTCT